MNITEATIELSSDASPAIHDLGGISNADLLDAWNQDHEPAAMAVLVNRYSVMVLSVCRRRCRSYADADDAYQTTFLYLARNSIKIRHPERLAGWLHRVAQRAAVAVSQSCKRETETMVEPIANCDDPLDRLTQRHEAIVLDEELSELPEHYRAAIVMHLYEGTTLESLAESLGTTVGSVRGRLQRGKKLLADRLRRRGVVPVLAFAAANALTVSTTTAGQVSEPLIDSLQRGDLPDSPVDPHLLDSLLSQGTRLMPSLFTTLAGLIVGSAILGLMMVTGSAGQPREQAETITIPGHLAQFAGGGGGVGGGSGLAFTTEPRDKPTQKPLDKKLAGEKTEASHGGSRGTRTMWAEQTVVPDPVGEVAEDALRAMEQSFEFNVDVTLDDLPTALESITGVPVIIDDRGVAFAELPQDETRFKLTARELPLKTALRKMLRPHGLRSTVENDGMVITADTATLVHKGIGVSRWINVDEAAAKKVAEALQSSQGHSFVDTPLDEVMQKISHDFRLPILIDRRALEELGLTADTPVRLELKDVQLKTVLDIMLAGLDLTYTIQGDTLMVTTVEAAEALLLTRIYWLEGTGVAGDSKTITTLIQSTIRPDAWEALGGTSTMAPFQSTRPALLISTTFEVHQQIESLLQTLRESHFGPDPVLESVEVPMPMSMQGMGGGMGGMGGGGMF
ncbi:ECF RNA polymerase sigma factor SigE [Novipirellula galeiformis]|uniref:ECF RNA polymerase sigma factor SigE n=1 Tax=Novipirellula galeiformis TaxID=2528004 RepID=A0A5C6CEN0_9BACT|nr:sigma-70 family RNA polymerase sigma factor [Novipirellula galeiformis]TWU22207.1 ECF RNA polymerase sigma factor SigE [Novipirellula galeiformis]